MPDTATEILAALKIGENVFSRCEYVPRDHTLRILPLVDVVLQEAQVTLNDLDALASVAALAVLLVFELRELLG